MQDTARDGVPQLTSAGSKTVRHRVLKWLHADQQPAASWAHADPGSSTHVAAKPVPVSNALQAPPSGGQDIPVQKRAAKMWKRWKCAIAPGRASSKLSRAVLSQYDSQQSMDDIYSSASVLPVNAAAHTTSGAAASAAMPSNMATAYRSSLYDQTPSSSASATPRATVQHSPASASAASTAVLAHTPTAPSTAAAALPPHQPVKLAAAPGGPGGAHRQQLQPSPSQQRRHAAKQPAAASLPHSETAWASCSSSHWQQLHSLPAAAAAAAAGSSLPGPLVMPPAAAAATPCKVAALVGLASPLDRVPSGSSSMPLSPITPSAAAHTLQLQRSISKGSSGSPASAASPCLARACHSLPGTPWQQRSVPTAPWKQQQQQQAVSALPRSTASPLAPSPAHSPPQVVRAAQPAASSSLYLHSRAAAGVGSSSSGAAAAAYLAGTAMAAYPGLLPAAAPAQPAAVTASPSTAGSNSSSSNNSAELSRWLLRAALLEDELQGRALEVGEGLAAAAERREQLEAALLGMGGAAVAGSRLDVMRQQLSQERDSTAAAAAALSHRASQLGSGLASLQGCLTVLQGSRGGKLTPSSKLGVLQLVLGDVVARLPGEGLAQLELVQGLPGLQQMAGQAAADSAASCKPATCSAADGLAGWHANSGSAAAQRRSHWHQQQQQQQQHEDDDDDDWTVEAEDAVLIGDGESDEDDAVVATLSTALSSKFYTPRHSLAYESRRGSLAAEQAAEQYSGYFERRPDNSTANSSQPLQQQQQQQHGQLLPASVAAAAAAAKAVLAVVEEPAVKDSNTPPAAAAGRAAGPAAAAAPAGLRKSNSRLALQPLLEAEPLDCWDEDSACFQSAASSICSGSHACFTAASQGGELEQVLAYHSTASTPLTGHSTHAASAVLSDAGTGVAADHIRRLQLADAQPTMPVPHHDTRSLAAPGGGDLGSLPVQGLLSAVGGPDLGCLTVGELLQLLTQAVLQQQRSPAGH
uniref:Uncharacterized protein n=1 Tax=Tetradesmus obliquus TaxID=3088 RepID=A0A383V4M8_TETOB|eukprot:jgi/Sobl393_1/7766/SZX59534.1